MRPGKRVSISSQRERFCISTPRRSLRISPASRRALKCCDKVDFGNEFAPLEAITAEHFHKHFNVNVLGVLLTTQAAAKHLGEGASVINISSGVTRLAPANTAVYSGTKGALDVITSVLAKELGPKKIRVNAINPGMVETEGTVSAGFIGSDFEKALIAQAPLGRTGRTDDIADIAVFPASNDSRWMTGEQLLATGGIR